MIKKWEMLPIQTQESQNRFVVYIQGDHDDVKQLVSKFHMICQEPFEINQDNFNWAFYIVNSTQDERLNIQEFLRQKEKETPETQRDSKIDLIEDNLRVLVEEVKKVIQDLDKKGLTVEELKAIEQKKEEQEALKEKEKIKIIKEEKIKRYELEEIRIGYLFPVKDEPRFNIFMDTLNNVEQITSKKPIGLKKIFADAYNPFDKSFKLDSIIKLFKNYRIETLVILTPDSRMVPKEKEIIEELKRKLKRKVLFKIVPLTKVSKRSIYLGLIVDVALFKEKGLDYFRLKP